jgi:excisionase family DNA binding protein
LSTLPETTPHQQPAAEVLRGVAKALDQLGVLVLHLAAATELTPLADEDPLLTVSEAAAELRCSASHIRGACRRGQIEAMSNGGWRIRRSALQAYERRRTRPCRQTRKGTAV